MTTGVKRLAGGCQRCHVQGGVKKTAIHIPQAAQGFSRGAEESCPSLLKGPGGMEAAPLGCWWLWLAEGWPLLSSGLHTFLQRQDSALGAAISIDQNWLEMQIKKEITTM